jgi:hypothetical protein
MVVGLVQSGKTASYTGLVCKAADAGYRLIVVIAAIHTNLRNQTQARIDEGFIGRDTGRLTHANKAQRQKIIGVGQFDQREFPVSLTNTIKDFNKATATTNTSQIGQYNVPVILVIKKNSSTLKNLLEWLQENSAHEGTQIVSQPMLLIDDEADNASINTGLLQGRGHPHQRPDPRASLAVPPQLLCRLYRHALRQHLHRSRHGGRSEGPRPVSAAFHHRT